jgi:hypothetical protein
LGSKVFHGESTTGSTYAEAHLINNPSPYDAQERKNRLIEIRKSNLPFGPEGSYKTTNVEMQTLVESGS